MNSSEWKRPRKLLLILSMCTVILRLTSYIYLIHKRNQYIVGKKYIFLQHLYPCLCLANIYPIIERGVVFSRTQMRRPELPRLAHLTVEVVAILVGHTARQRHIGLRDACQRVPKVGYQGMHSYRIVTGYKPELPCFRT